MPNLRNNVIDTLTGAGIVVAPWGTITSNDQFAIVRPIGITLDREQVEVWIVNHRGQQKRDRDEGLAEFAQQIHLLIRDMAIDLSTVQGPDYDPSGKSPRTTLILTATSACQITT